jgi:uncharacterized membrane protein YoaT (DUF817 family)
MRCYVLESFYCTISYCIFVYSAVKCRSVCICRVAKVDNDILAKFADTVDCTLMLYYRNFFTFHVCNNISDLLVTIIVNNDEI